MRDRTIKSRFYTDNFLRRSGRLMYFAYHGTLLFVEQPVVSFSLYNRANQWLLESGWDGSTTFNSSSLKMYGRNRWSLTFLVDLLSNYTFYTNLIIFSFRRLLIEYVTSLIVFNLWQIEKIMQHGLMPVYPYDPVLFSYSPHNSMFKPFFRTNLLNSHTVQSNLLTIHIMAKQYWPWPVC